LTFFTAPWTDVFGRYFNRSRGKPLFVSCLIYLNDEWDGDLGAPTQFYDPPSEEVYEVYPRPGRCVMMDQDITHSVVPPNKAAGKLPRYSLVWKLILHPRKDMQPMKSTSGCPTVCFGSANTVSQ
jgi:probable phosphoglycerate mutase